MAKRKTKKCRICKDSFEVFNSLQFTCSAKCALIWAKKDLEKKRKKEHKEAKERVKTRGEWIREAQAEFNRYVRLRDKDLGCICCGCTTSDDDLLTGSRWDAGHYLSVGARPNLRFNEDNCHKQSVKCNRNLSGNAAAYRIELVKKIGIERVEALECDHKPKSYTIEDIKEIKRRYKQKCKELK